ncbi:MAG TPA: SDR family oxidoreductase [Acidimicrobiales bacterium]|nr:SDR family oxidoreductase [Acidimicrobiales bacterium]
MTGPAALVTGARRGIGRATAVALAQTGMRVAVTSRTVSGLADTVDDIEAAGGSALPIELDLSNRASIDATLEQVHRAWGPLDVLVNNALCEQPASQDLIAQMDFAAFETMIAGEVVNTSYLTRQAIAYRPDTSGPLTVIVVGSAAADHVPPKPYGQGGFAFSYSASKAALHRLAAFLQLEYGLPKVRAFTINPGVVRTEALLEHLGDIPGSAPASLPAAVIKWLAVDPAADAHLGGYLHAQTIAADLGLRLDS